MATTKTGSVVGREVWTVTNEFDIYVGFMIRVDGAWRAFSEHLEDVRSNELDGLWTEQSDATEGLLDYNYKIRGYNEPRLSEV